MSKRISVLVALEGADEGLKRAIASAERSLGCPRPPRPAVPKPQQ